MKVEYPEIKSVSLCDPLILLIFKNDQGLILEGDFESKTFSPMETSIYPLFLLPQENEEYKIKSATLYTDTYLWLNEGSPSILFPKPLFCVVCRLNGTLEIYDLPQMQYIFLKLFFALAWDTCVSDHNCIQDALNKIDQNTRLNIPYISEV